MKIVILLVLTFTNFIFQKILSSNISVFKELKQNKRDNNETVLYSYMGGVQSAVINGVLVPTNTESMINTSNGKATPVTSGMIVSGGKIMTTSASSIPYGSGYTFSK